MGNLYNEFQVQIVTYETEIFQYVVHNTFLVSQMFIVGGFGLSSNLYVCSLKYLTQKRNFRRYLDIYTE